MIYVGDTVCNPYNPAFERISHSAGMIQNTVLYRLCQVQRFEHLDNTNALPVMSKITVKTALKYTLSGMTERCVPQIVPKTNSFTQILVESESPCNCPRNLSDLHSMGKSGTVMIGLRSQKHLSFPHQPPECLRMYNSVPVPLKGTAQIAFAYSVTSSA